MPKKLLTVNPKAVAAKDRKSASKIEAKLKEEKEADDAKWQETNKLLLKKQQKKEVDERKKQEQQQRKQESKAQLEREMQSSRSAKVTRAQIDCRQEPKKNVNFNHIAGPLEENWNRIDKGEEARNVDEAIRILEDDDRHPERRAKTLFAAYEKRRLRELKEENPKLRLSQLKQIVFKEWQRSSENPFNKI